MVPRFHWVIGRWLRARRARFQVDAFVIQVWAWSGLCRLNHFKWQINHLEGHNLEWRGGFLAFHHAQGKADGPVERVPPKPSGVGKASRPGHVANSHNRLLKVIDSPLIPFNPEESP